MATELQIYIEDSLLYAEEFFKDVGNITRFSGYKVQPQDISDADVLLTRSTTKVSRELVSQAKNLKFVGTATAGYDHIDGKALEDKGIHWTAAGGCNADAVADYVLSALFIIAQESMFELADKSVAVVGVGEVGSRIVERVNALGCQVIAYDPVRAQNDASFTSASLDEVLAADIISCHVPLTHDNEFATDKMFGAAQFAKMREDVIFINACRGEIVDEAALKTHMQAKPKTKLVLDVFDNEPNIDLEIMELAMFASPHIAGHSLEGKARGTEMLYFKLCDFFGLNKQHQLHDFLPPMRVDNIDLAASCQFEQSILRKITHLVYDIRDDNVWFKNAMRQDASQFKSLRRSYPIRREMTSLVVRHPAHDIQDKLTQLSLRATK
ncbi:DUF3410 domain-containing protein [Saccharobesus litoralis]|uniref:Erythronate-4-phosphate dehydrogenase n=1 Tax=Saccharobesus litoralis TaxID=2172099 RepID=A0A2S0VV22_9ALTE|nr:4-phosphoerythronate dehydrogenase [Saccharobesus litoralis]AWB68074.1 DUF3410 domain-containing protein [Saccharobesus litoralis]